jgi:hypothetical protein
MPMLAKSMPDERAQMMQQIVQAAKTDRKMKIKVSKCARARVGSQYERW